MTKVKNEQDCALSVLQHQVNALRRARFDQDKQIEDLIDRVEELEDKIEELEDRTEDMDRNISDLEADLGKLEFDEDR